MIDRKTICQRLVEVLTLPGGRIVKVWSGTYPPKPASASLIERVVITLLLLAKASSLCVILKSVLWPPSWENLHPAESMWWRKTVTDLYVVATTIVLTILLFCHPPGNWAPWLAAYFMYESVATTLSVQFVEYYGPGGEPYSANRSIILLFVGYLEIMIGFAIIYLASGGVYHGTEVVSSPGTAFYFSCVTIVTLGYGDITPISGCARACAVTEVITGMLMLVLMLSAFLNLAAARRSNQSADGNIGNGSDRQ